MNTLMPSVSANVDASSIQKAVALGIKGSSRKMELLLADTAFYTARYAYVAMPAAELSDIAGSLNTVVHTSKSKINGLGGLQWTKGMMIAVQRTNPNSKYSRITGNRWPLAKPTRPRGSIENWRYFVNAADRMEAGRNSSTHFLKLGWRPVFKAIKALGLRGLPAVPANENTLTDLEAKDSMGGIERGGQGTSSQWFKIENRIGMGGGGPLAAEHNAALMDYGIPALQWAVNRQAQDMKEHNLEKKIGEDLRREWESVPDAPAYQKGFHNSAVRWAEDQGASEMETSLA